MKHVILEAMKQLLKYEEGIGRAVPRPTYLFVEKYGRTMEPVLQETAEAFGKKKYVVLRNEKEGKEKSLLDRLHVETQKRSDVGKQFDGFVLVELSGEEAAKERVSLYEYIKKNSSKIACMFTVKDEETAEMLQKEMEQYFPFVRAAFEECYSPEEQKEILMTALEQGGAALTKGAGNQVAEMFGEVGWKTTDHVENKLRNLANNLVYEQIMKGDAQGLISGEELQKAMLRLTEEQAEKMPIGFAPPKETQEHNVDCPEKDGKELVA